VNVIELLQREQEKTEVPVLRSGDTVRVHVRVVEGTRERIQAFEGLIIAIGGKTGLDTSFTVRRISHGIGVERTFLVHSPRLDRIEVLRHGDVRRGKLYYLRDKVGKRARVRERREPIGGSAMVFRRDGDVAPGAGSQVLADATVESGGVAEDPLDQATVPAEPPDQTPEPAEAAVAAGSEKADGKEE